MAMRARSVCCLAVGTLALAGCGTATADRLIVSVVSPADNPISGATVSVVGTSVSGRTDASGNARLSGLAAGSYNVTASAVGYYSGEDRNISVPDSGTETLALTYAPPLGGYVMHVNTNGTSDEWWELVVIPSKVQAIDYTFNCQVGSWQVILQNPPAATGPGQLGPGWRRGTFSLHGPDSSPACPTYSHLHPPEPPPRPITSG